MRLVAFALVLLLMFSVTRPAYGASCVPSSPAFTVRGASWGTASNPVDAGPGDSNVPLVVTLQYYDVCNVNAVQGTISMPAGFVSVSGSSTATAFAVSILPNSVFELEFPLNILPTAKIGSYFFPMQLTWNVSGGSGRQSSNISIDLKGDVKLSVTQSEASLVAGEVNVVSLTLVNTGSGKATDVTVTLLPSQGVSVIRQQQGTFDLNSSGFVVYSVGLFAASAEVGSPVSLTFTATFVDPYLDQRTFSQVLGFYVQNTPAPSYTLTASTPVLTSGSVNDVYVTLTNRGGSEIRSVSILVTASAGIGIIGSDGRFGTAMVAPAGNYTFPLAIYVPSTAQPVASLSFDVTYVTPVSSVADEKVISFLVTNQQPQSDITVTVAPKEIIIGELSNVTVTVSNGWGSPISNLTVLFAFPGTSVSWIGPNELQRATLKNGENVSTIGTVYDPPNAPPTAVLQLFVTYYLNGVLHQETRSFEMVSRGLIDMRLTSVTVLPQAVSPGQIVSLTLTLTNLGTVAAADVSAVPVVPAGFTIFGSSSSYFVGDMQGGSPSTFTLTILVSNSTKAGTYKIPVTVSYMDNLRDSLTSTFDISVTVANVTAGQRLVHPNGGELVGDPRLVFVVSITAAAAVGYLFGRRSTVKRRTSVP